MCRYLPCNVFWPSHWPNVAALRFAIGRRRVIASGRRLCAGDNRRSTPSVSSRLELRGCRLTRPRAQQTRVRRLCHLTDMCRKMFAVDLRIFVLFSCALGACEAATASGGTSNGEFLNFWPARATGAVVLNRCWSYRKTFSSGHCD